jgi:hypothetical protein
VALAVEVGKGLAALTHEEVAEAVVGLVEAEVEEGWEL